MRQQVSLNPGRAKVTGVALAFGLGWLCVAVPAFSATKSSVASANRPFAYDTSGIVSVAADPASVSGPAVLQFQGVTGASFNPTVVQPINLGQFVATPSSVGSGQVTTYSGTPFEVEVQAPELNKSSSVPVLSQIFPSLDKKLNLKSSVENSLLLKGHLDGTVGANGQVNVTATVDSIKLGSFDGASSSQVVHYTFPIRYSQLVLPPNFVMTGSTSSVTAPTSSPNPIMSALSTSPNASSTPTSTTTTSTSGPVAPAPAAEMVTVATASASASAIANASAAAPVTAPLPVAAPEPSTIVLFATVLGGLALGRRHFANQQSP